MRKKLPPQELRLMAFEARDGSRSMVIGRWAKSKAVRYPAAMPFQHPDGRTIYALLYWLVTRPPQSRSLCVWLNEHGNDANGHTGHAEPGRLVATTKPGERLLWKGQRV